MKGYDRGKLQDAEIKEQILKMFEKETGGDFESYQVPEDQKEQITEQTIKDQKASLDRWFEYLTGPEAENYPDAFKYWAFAETLKLGAQDRERKDFNKRTKETAAPFPPLNQQALARVLDEVLRKRSGKSSALALDEEQKKDFQKRLQSENFGKLYGWALDYVNSLKLPTERLPIIEGEWRKFAKGTDPKELVDSILEFNTGWCIDGEGTAESYLSRSDAWIYFSQDKEGENSIPRAAVITDGSSITEVRGIIQTEKVKQHLDDYITPVVDEKLGELPGGEAWQGSMEDMKKLAEIHFKHIQKEQLTKEDLTFLYELDKPIQSMGYGKDPRIAELREGRNIEEDMPIIFECTPEQIAHNASEVTENTKAYVGPITKDIFNKLAHVEHIYTTFPEGRVLQYHIEIGGKTKEEIIKEMEEKNINISNYAKDMLEKTEFSSTKENADLDMKATLKELSFNIGGHLLHSLFWGNLAPAGQQDKPAGMLGEAIKGEFGSFERFRKEFTQAAVSVEGSGWAALAFCKKTNRPLIMQIEKHNVNLYPNFEILMMLDVWEHAYYLDYKNERAKFVEAFWNIVKWSEVNRRLEELM